MSKRERQPSQPSSAVKKTKTSKGIAELDDIFATKKAAAIEKKEEEKRANEVAKSKSGSNPRSGTTGSTTKKLTHSRHDVEDVAPNAWVDDGLGGKFNREGYTGRVEGGVKVFKAHLFNKKNFGQSKDCPFDCDCCYI
jgi:hypothetical protein